MERDKILVTSSDNIPYSEIQRQLGIVDSQIVVGANIFRDAFAGIRDLFGGETKGYKKDIDKMKIAALSNLKNQAKEKGANAIIALRIDLNEVSGGGKSMFMLNVYGSAVKLEEKILTNEDGSNDLQEFSYDDIKYFRTMNSVKKEIETSEEVVRNVNPNSITKYDLWNTEVVRSFLKGYYKVDYNKRQKIIDNISEIPVELLEEFLSNNLDEIDSSLWSHVYNGLESKNWFNYSFLEKYLADENHIKRFRALQLCSIEKDYYEINEVTDLRRIGNFILKKFDSSLPTEVVTKMINKKEIYTCPNCLKETDTNRLYCECGANKYGLEPVELTPNSIGKNLREIAEAIESVFKKLN